MFLFQAGAKSPIAFTHNDLINGNLMEVEGEVRLIDFEYGFYAHSAHDIGNHFLEWTINYEFPEPPLYEIRHEDYPSEAQQRRFVRSYLTARGEGAVSDAAVEAFVAESKLFTMASHFMWACWGLVQVRKNTRQCLLPPPPRFPLLLPSLLPSPPPADGVGASSRRRGSRRSTLGTCSTASTVSKATCTARSSSNEAGASRQPFRRATVLSQV